MVTLTSWNGDCFSRPVIGFSRTVHQTVTNQIQDALSRELVPYNARNPEGAGAEASTLSGLSCHSIGKAGPRPETVPKEPKLPRIGREVALVSVLRTYETATGQSRGSNRIVFACFPGFSRPVNAPGSTGRDRVRAVDWVEPPRT